MADVISCDIMEWWINNCVNVVSFSNMIHNDISYHICNILVSNWYNTITDGPLFRGGGGGGGYDVYCTNVELRMQVDLKCVIL